MKGKHPSYKKTCIKNDGRPSTLALWWSRNKSQLPRLKEVRVRVIIDWSTPQTRQDKTRQDKTRIYPFLFTPPHPPNSRHYLCSRQLFILHIRELLLKSLYPSHLLKWIVLDGIVMAVTLFSVNKISWIM